MNTDIVETIYDFAAQHPENECFAYMVADEIERLRAQVKKLELDIEASDADRHFHDDFYTPPEDYND